MGHGEIDAASGKRRSKSSTSASPSIARAASEAARRRSGVGADRAGQVGNDRRAATSGEPKSLQPIDPQHDLMSPVAVGRPGLRVPRRLDADRRRHAIRLEEVKRSEHRAGVVRMVVTPANTISVQALYRIRSARQRVEIALPEGAMFDAAAAADQRPAGGPGEGRAERVFRAAGRPPIPTRPS